MSTNLPHMRTLGIIDQISQATRKHHRLSLLAGFLLGGFIPFASYTVCHFECTERPILWTLVLAGLAYSAFTVFEWAKVAFKHPAKALGFVILMEGIVIFSGTRWLSISALVVMIFINGIATACNLIADRRETRKKKGNK